MTLAQTRGTQASGTGEQRYRGASSAPTDVKAAFNFEFDDIDIDVPMERIPGRGVQGHSPLARDADPAARGRG